MTEKIQKTDAEWLAQLGEARYRICRQGGTERAFTGEYWDNKAPGIYRCACCGTPLFDAAAKYDSGSGWPSFWEPVDEQCIEQEIDTRHGMTRIEIHCRRCGCHLGHVFEDGPPPTGLRYCINSASLDFEAAG